jgi:hypothetical protein
MELEGEEKPIKTPEFEAIVMETDFPTNNDTIEGEVIDSAMSKEEGDFHFDSQTSPSEKVSNRTIQDTDSPVVESDEDK